MSLEDWANAALALSNPQPIAPSRHTVAYQDKCFERLLHRRLQLRDRVYASTAGRVAPDIDDLAIGEGKHFDNLSVLFLDICKFSERLNWTTDEQRKVLETLNLFMGEMLSIVRDFDGCFEKNTGDGLMAYFGAEATTAEESVKQAVEAAVMMHYVNDEFVNYFFKKDGIEPVVFRIGLDVGPVTLAKVAIHGGTHGSILAIGTTANVACKMMNLLPEGGICVGQQAHNVLPNGWKSTCQKLDGSTGHIYRMNDLPYPAWKLGYRAPYIPFN